MSETNPENKEPKTYAEFAIKAIAKVKKDLIEQRARWITRGDIKESKKKDLHAMVARGDMAANFVQTSFWTEHLRPYIIEQGAKAEMKPWRPGQPYNHITLRTEWFFHSGKHFICERLLALPYEWIELGRDASRDLAYEKEQRRRSAKESMRV